MKNELKFLLVAAITFGSAVPVAQALALQGYMNSSCAQVSTIEGLNLIRGGGLAIPGWVRNSAVAIVKTGLGSVIASRLYNLLSKDKIPSFSDYKREFGSDAAKVLALIPWYLKPLIVE